MTTQEKEHLERYMQKVAERAATSIGCPFATDFDGSELHPLLRYSLNNLGDPFIESIYDVNSHSIEKEVVGFFAGLFRAPKDNSWGYVTNGGTEGNLYGLYVARELYPQAMVYYSAATHYSVRKSTHLLNMQSIVIRAGANGEMDYDYLRAALEIHRHQPAIIVANIGTTMTEAKDDVDTIRDILQDAGVKSYYIHCDAALAGIYLALLQRDPKFDFMHGADSITISGHKFIGSPIPCGVLIVKKNYRDRIGRPVSYIGSLDSTIGSSRNGYTPVFLWHVIKQLGKEGLLKRALESLSLAEYTQRRLQECGIPAYRNENAITVVFPKPPESLCHKWQLANEGEQAHVICVPGVSKGMIDDFIDELLREKNETSDEQPLNNVYA